jgi:putative chitinase
MQITAAILKKLCPSAKAAIINDLEQYLAPTLERYEINTPLRVMNFLAQAAHESAGFKTLKEYWGPTAAQKGYEGRKDLGNTQAGDGKLFMGRGIFQLTGRANYATYGKLLGVDFVSNPDMVATGKYSMLTACEYWKSRKLNALADNDDTVAITKKINGGTNGLAERLAYRKAAKGLIDEIFAVATPVHPDDKPAADAPAPVVQELVLMKKGDDNDGIRVIQIMLQNKMQMPLTIDGNFGPATDAAVKAFQKKNGLNPDGLVTPSLYKLILAKDAK